MPSATDRSPSVQRQPSHHRPRTQSPPPKRLRTTPPPSISESPSPPCSIPTKPLSVRSEPHPASSTKWFRKPSVVWYRGNDLRVEDHPALFTAAQRGGPVIPLFVWDPSDGFGAGIGTVKQWWLRQSLQQLQNDLRRLGVQLYTRKGKSTEELRRFLTDTGADAVFWNRCYEPLLLKRDEELREELAHEGFTAESFKAEVLVEPWELASSETSPRYETFHAYMTAWMTVAPPPHPLPSPSRLQPISRIVHSVGLDLLGFEISDDVSDKLGKIWKPGSAQAKRQLDRFLNEVFPTFGESRCRRHYDGTSRLSPHIRFGEISPRRMYHATKLRVSRWDLASISRSFRQGPKAREHHPVGTDKPGNGDNHKIRKLGNDSLSTRHTLAANNLTPRGGRSGSHRKLGTSKDHVEQEYVLSGKAQALLSQISQSARAFLKNLCLRDFSFHVLYHFPDMNTKPLIPEFSKYPWGEDNGLFDRWRNGVTGYPIVDAAMRQLNESGWVHNGLRFLLACFLTKYLSLPWSKGLRLFYKLLVDGDHSSNALGWQWTAGSNTDAFPVTSLVNPIRLAYKHDPNGDYVRRWLPELAKLPAKYIHRPWKAPQDLLRKCGVIIGSTYPDRIVHALHARQRALEAVTVMKQIFAANTLWKRRFQEEEEKLVVEWPEGGSEALKHDELSNGPGKCFLLPSIWALLQGEQSPCYFPSSSGSGNSLIPMDTTACLVDGALAIPMDDQPESIEQALISTRGYVDADSRLSSEALLSPENRGGETQCMTQAGGTEPSCGLYIGVNDKCEDVEQIGEHLKYSAVEPNSYTEEEKPQDHFDEECTLAGSKIKNEKPKNQPPAGYNGNDCDMNSPATASNQEMADPRPIPSSFRKVPTGTSNKSEPVAANYQNAELQQFVKSQNPDGDINPPQNAARSNFLSTSSAHPSQPRSSVSSQPIDHFTGTNDIQRSAEMPQQLRGTGQHPSLTDGVHHVASDFAEVPLTSQHIQVTAAQHANISSVQHVSQQHFPTSMAVEMDSMYAPRVSATAVHVSHMPGTTVLNPNDMGSAHVFAEGEGANPTQPYHVRPHQFYGLRQFVPVMSAQPMNPGEQPSSIHLSAAHSQKIAVPRMFPLPYGMYGNAVVDHNMFTGHMNQARFSANVYPAQPQATAPLQTRAQEISPHPMPFQIGLHTDVHQPQSSANFQHGHQNPGFPVENINGGISMHASAVPTNGSSLRATGHILQQSGSSHHAGGQVQDIAKAPQIPSNRFPEASRQGSIPTESSPATPYEYMNSYGNKNATSRTGALQRTRSSAKSSSKPRNTRAKRLGKNQVSSSRGKNEGRKGSRNRVGGSGSDTISTRGGTTPIDTGTTPKNRQKILESVLGSEDNEYRGFAQYLSETYEFTGNTNRQTSRDYVRLCNLKDDYHKKCRTEKDKLKIYRIKDFFSKVLKLEVTGEWDRHNHGGVRGPYVYGIRLKQQTNSKLNLIM
ncbi:unnamed protein product [Agarophyton chilense]